jgi:endonuclease/exonuclease/phosphatase family metal-dependent hydrolase
MVHHGNIRLAAQDAQKATFLAELVRMCENQTLSMLAEGDFNTIRSPQEKNNNSYNAHWPFIFTAIIGSLNLREIILSGRQCTLARRRKTRTYEKLDRVLASVDWEQKYSLVSFRALSRSVFDHIPLLIDYGEQAIRLSFVLNYLGFGRMVFMI